MEQSSLQKKKFNQKFLHIIGPMECRKMFIERWVHYSHSAFVYFLVGCHAGALSLPGWHHLCPPSLSPEWRHFNIDLEKPGNAKGGSVSVPLTYCLTGLESAAWQLTIFVFICKTDQSKPVKQEVNSTVILPPLVFPGETNLSLYKHFCQWRLNFL